MRRQQFLLFRVYRFQDTEAYGELYDLYFERIHRFIFFKLPAREDVEELTAEVFLRGWEYATSSRVENAGALFYRIARNVIADFYRQRKEEASLEEAQHVPSGEDVAGRAQKKQEGDALIKQLRALRADYQEVLVMRFLDEMEIREIAAVLEKTPNNVRVLIYRAKKALQKISNE